MFTYYHNSITILTSITNIVNNNIIVIIWSTYSHNTIMLYVVSGTLSRMPARGGPKAHQCYRIIMDMCMYIYIYIYIYTHTHIHISVYIYIHMYISVSISLSLSLSLCLCIYIYIYIYIYTTSYNIVREGCASRGARDAGLDARFIFEHTSEIHRIMLIQP